MSQPDEKLYNVTVTVSVSVYGASEEAAIAGVKQALDSGLDEEYSTKADGFYSASAEEVDE
jgi:hypothetical protein